MTELRERVLELLGSEDRALALGEILELLDEGRARHLASETDSEGTG